MPSSQPTTTQAEGDHEAEHGAEHAELLLKRKVLFFFSPEISSYFIAGGVAGAASRTVVSPLERLKIIQSVFIADPIVQTDSGNSTDKSSHRALICNTRAFGEALFECGGKKDSRVICEEML
jgi:hypothetical protein